MPTTVPVQQPTAKRHPKPAKPSRASLGCPNALFLQTRHGMSSPPAVLRCLESLRPSTWDHGRASFLYRAPAIEDENPSVHFRPYGLSFLTKQLIQFAATRSLAVETSLEPQFHLHTEN
ncbi:hypothetical protein Mapa_005870 [Marchantia paleacea]|nr:hypothetical protein Mapa_005870 [Marchantia paleacea]